MQTKKTEDSLKIITVNIAESILETIQIFTDLGFVASRSEFVRQSLSLGIEHYKEVIKKCSHVIFGRKILVREMGRNKENGNKTYPQGQKTPLYLRKKLTNANKRLKIGNKYYDVIKKMEDNPNGDK